ncbi:uncharacterized protein [Miscanthus floridulus]|uniref:uncharacterized protein n=1 Tax=Miscanthus floridulus TaxID=154761 RepID=UPI00345ACE81
MYEIHKVERMMEQRMLWPAAPSTSCARPLAGRPHPAEPGRGAAAGPTLRPARGVVEAAQPLRPASSVAEAARRRLLVHRPQGSLPRPDQEDCGGMFLDLERDFLALVICEICNAFFVLDDWLAVTQDAQTCTILSICGEISVCCCLYVL